MSDDPWVAVLRSCAGNDVALSVDEVDSLAWHVIICRESALSGNVEWCQSLNGLPDSSAVAHWHDAHLIGSAVEQERRFDQAVAMAVGLNEQEAIQ